MSFWVRKHGKIEKKILNHFWAIAGHFTGENGIFVGFYHEKIVSFKSIAVKIILLTGIRRGHTDNHSHVVWSLYLLWFIFYRTSKFKKWGKTHIFQYTKSCHSVTMCSKITKKIWWGSPLSWQTYDVYWMSLSHILFGLRFFENVLKTIFRNVLISESVNFSRRDSIQLLADAQWSYYGTRTQ